MTKWIKRIFVGLIFALPIAVLGFALTQTPAQAQPENPTSLDCRICHSAFQEAWESGDHGKAAIDPVFRDAWRAQGQPQSCLACHTTGYDPATGEWEAEGVGCIACHSPVTENHPAEPMAADRSAKLCGECHTETYFEWQVSGHRREDLDCVGCHDPHGTALKADDASALCASCHRTRASNFAHSQHSAQGLTCADCHLGLLEGDLGEGHAFRDHSFHVQLSTCNACHAYQMHDPVEVHPEPATPLPPETLTSAETVTLIEEPAPMSPIGFAALSGLIGMATGMILAPWLERWYRRLNEDEE